jgi:hypothetical protein
VLGYFNQRDLEGTYVNGASMPAVGGAATAFSVVLPIPVSLAQFIEDGAIFTQGSKSLKDGRIEYKAGASLTPTCVLAGGSVTISAVSVSLMAVSGAGTADDVGMSWRFTCPSGKPTIDELLPAGAGSFRLGLFHTAAVSASTITLISIGDYVNTAPAFLGAGYQGDRLSAGGFDITARCTPLITLPRRTKFVDFVAYVDKSYRYDVTGPASMAFIDIVALPPHAEAIATVSTAVGGGGGVVPVNVNPPSLPAGVPVPPTLISLVPQRILPGAVTANPLVKAANPLAAAEQHKAKQTGSMLKRISARLGRKK